VLLAKALSIVILATSVLFVRTVNK
jgi:hypothetical protein